MERKIDWTKFRHVSFNLWKSFKENFIIFPLTLLSHPIKGFNQLKLKERGNIFVATAILFLSAIAAVFEPMYSSFIVFDFNPETMNSLLIMGYQIIPILFFVIANWSVTTLMNGKGKVKEIYMVFCYANFPVLLITIFNIIFSQFITLDELGFYRIFATTGVVLMCYLVLMGLLVVHEFGLGSLVIAMVATILALVIILFLCLTLFDLSQQIYGFFYSLIKEIMVRMS